MSSPAIRFREFDGDWKSVRFDDELVESKLGGNYANSETPTEHPLIKMGNLGRGLMNLRKMEFIEVGETIDPKDRMKDGDLFFNTRNTLDLVGKVAIWRSELPEAYYNSNLMRITFACNHFMNYRLNSFSGVKALRRLATGTTSVAAIYTRDLLKMKMTLPTLPEQRKIADFLTAVDGRIGQLSQKKSLLEDYKKGVMQQLFTQALRFKDNHGNDFPDWEEKGLGNSIDLLSGFPFASEDILDGQATNDRERILLMRGVNITEGSIRHSEDQDRYYCGDVAKLQKYKLEVGDMVIGMDGSKVGKNSALVGESEKGALLVQRVARIRALAGTSLPFIYQHVNSFLFHRYVDQVKTSSGIPHISAKQIREFTIGFPCLAEQTKIANFLTALDRKIESVSQQITQTQTFKKGLLQQMFV